MIGMRINPEQSAHDVVRKRTENFYASTQGARERRHQRALELQGAKDAAAMEREQFGATSRMELAEFGAEQTSEIEKAKNLAGIETAQFKAGTEAAKQAELKRQFEAKFGAGFFTKKPGWQFKEVEKPLFDATGERVVDPDTGLPQFKKGYIAFNPSDPKQSIDYDDLGGAQSPGVAKRVSALAGQTGVAAPAQTQGAIAVGGQPAIQPQSPVAPQASAGGGGYVMDASGRKIGVGGLAPGEGFARDETTGRTVGISPSGQITKGEDIYKGIERLPDDAMKMKAWMTLSPAQKRLYKEEIAYAEKAKKVEGEMGEFGLGVEPVSDTAFRAEERKLLTKQKGEKAYAVGKERMAKPVAGKVEQGVEAVLGTAISKALKESVPEPETQREIFDAAPPFVPPAVAQTVSEGTAKNINKAIAKLMKSTKTKKQKKQLSDWRTKVDKINKFTALRGRQFPIK